MKKKEGIAQTNKEGERLTTQKRHSLKDGPDGGKEKMGGKPNNNL